MEGRDTTTDTGLGIRARCLVCGAHAPARIHGERLIGRCSVCESDRLEPVEQADGSPAPPLRKREGRFARGE